MILHEAIKRSVQEMPGLNGVALVLKVIDVLGHTFTFQDYSMAVEGLIDMGDIREEEYTDPAIPYRIKSRYYPGWI